MVSNVNKNAMRLKRHVRVRGKVSGTPERPRLNVFRSNANIYAQIIDDVNGVTLVSANTLEKEFEGATGNCEAAKKVGTVTVEQINAAMKAASNESFGYNEDEIVSSDIIGMRFGSLFDATQTMVLPLENGTTQVQVVSWYDNENSYTSQMVRTIKHFGKLLGA